MTTETTETAEQKTTWYWLNDNERQVLLDFNPDAERIINERFGREILTETQYFPYTPIGTNQARQGVSEPWMPPKRIIIKERTSWTVEIHHPQDSSFTKHEQRWCVAAIVRKRYMLDFAKLAKAVMSDELASLPWSIYEPQLGEGVTQHVYLDCAGAGVNGAKKIALYVPTEYFRTKEFSAVEQFHNRVAVGYYRGTGFSVSAEQLKEWQDITASALTRPETLKMRELIEHN